MLQLTTSSLLPPVPEITLLLFVWEDAHDNEARYVYGPKGSISFGGQPSPQKLNIIFNCLSKLSDGTDRFELYKFATSRLDKITHYTAAGPHGPSHRPPHESSIAKAPSLHFSLDMEKSDSFYIDVLVKDRLFTDRIFSCDPQVENGTKT